MAPKTFIPSNTMVTPVNDPAWLNLRLVGYDSAYRTALAKQGFPAGVKYDVSNFITSLGLSEVAGEAAMKMDVTLADLSRRDASSKLRPLGVGTSFDLAGPSSNYYLGGSIRNYVQLFRGRTFTAPTKTSSTGKERSFTAYDAGTYLARTEAALVFLDKTFTQILVEVAHIYGFALWAIGDTKVRLGKIIMSPGWTLWDLFMECSRRTYERTGKAFYVSSDPAKKSLNLLEFGNSYPVKFHLVEGDPGTLLDYSYEDSAEDLRTRVVILTTEYDEEGEFKSNKVVRQGMVKGDLRDVFGDLLKIVTPDSSLESAYNPKDKDWVKIDKVLTEQMRQELANVGRTTQKATARGVYIPGIRVGARINAGTRLDDKLQEDWIVDSVRTTWEATGPTQEVDIVRTAADSAFGFVR